MENKILSHFSQKFNLKEVLRDRRIPDAARLAIRRGLEKLGRFPYQHLIPPTTGFLKSLGTLSDEQKLYEVRVSGPDKTPYRLPVISPSEKLFLILGFFPRRNADFQKQIRIAEERYQQYKNDSNSYEEINLEHEY